MPDNFPDININGTTMKRDMHGNVVTVHRGDTNNIVFTSSHLNRLVGEYVLNGIPCLWRNKAYAIMYSLSKNRLFLHSETDREGQYGDHILLTKEDALKLADIIYAHWGPNNKTD